MRLPCGILTVLALALAADLAPAGLVPQPDDPISTVTIPTSAIPAPDSPPPAAAEPAPAPEFSAEEKAHIAVGEVRFKSMWTSVDQVFAEYRGIQAQADAVARKLKDVRAGLEEIGKKQAAIKARIEAQQKPVQADLDKIRARQAEVKAVLNARPPDPPAPPEQVKGKLGPDNQPTPRGPVVNGSEQDPAAGEYRQQSMAALAKYRLEKKKYDTAVEKYQKARAAAQEEMASLEAAAQPFEVKLAEIEASFNPEVVPLADKASAAENEVTGLTQEAPLFKTRLDDMAAAIRLVAEPLRLRFDILDWEGNLWRTADLQKLIPTLQADVARDLKKAKADAVAAGKTLPPGYQPRSQDRLDAAQNLIRRANATQAPRR